MGTGQCADVRASKWKENYQSADRRLNGTRTWIVHRRSNKKPSKKKKELKNTYTNTTLTHTQPQVRTHQLFANYVSSSITLLWLYGVIFFHTHSCARSRTAFSYKQKRRHSRATNTPERIMYVELNGFEGSSVTSPYIHFYYLFISTY